MTGNRKHQLQRKRAVQKARQNRADARAKLLAQHRKLAACRKENRRRMAEVQDGEDDGPHSTVPPTDTEDEAAAGPRHSTVPRRPARSDDDPPDRLYGLRLRNVADAENEALEGTTDTTTESRRSDR